MSWFLLSQAEKAAGVAKRRMGIMTAGENAGSLRLRQPFRRLARLPNADRDGTAWGKNEDVRGVVFLALLLPWPVAAAPSRHLPARLQVEKAAGAERCLDQPELEHRVEDILQRPLADAGAALTVDVRFERTANAFDARVTASGSKSGQRWLHDTSPTCDALGEAVSVTIALLLDDARPDQDAPVLDTGTPPENAPAPVTASPASDTHPGTVRDLYARRWSARASLEVGGGYGLGGSGAGLGLGRLGARRGGWLLDLAAAGTLPSEQSFERGRVRTSLLFGNVRACYLIGRSRLVGPCAQLGVGRLRGAGDGYGQVQAASLPWTAMGLGLAGETPLVGSLYLAYAATLWVPTRRQTFSVENVGIAWESKPVAGLLTAGLGVALF